MAQIGAVRAAIRIEDGLVTLPASARASAVKAFARLQELRVAG